MTVNSEYKQHMAVVKLAPSSKISSITPQKTLVSKELYYQNRAEIEHDQESSPNYCNYNNERSA